MISLWVCIWGMHQTFCSNRALRKDTLCSSSFLSRSCCDSVCILILLWYAFRSSSSCCSCIRNTWHSDSCASSSRNCDGRKSVPFKMTSKSPPCPEVQWWLVCASLTACVESISLIEWSYCSARMASLRVCSSFSLFSMVLCSDLGVLSSSWFFRALYCRVWILHVSWNCFLIWTSLGWWKNSKSRLGLGL